MKNTSNLLILLLIAAILILSSVLAFRDPSPQSVKETRLQRIEKTGILRCGYTIWPPALIKDPNTGKMSGIFYDLMEEIGKQLDYKIEWTMEISPPHMFDDMAANRYDMVCSPYLPTPARAKIGLFSNPIFYNSLNLYVRKDDARFDYDHERANKPDVRFAATDGNVMSLVTAKKFPKATLIGLPEYSTPADTFLHVITNKADVVISEPLTFALYNQNNPNKMRRVKGQPLTTSGVCMPLPAEAYDLKYAIDTTLQFLQDEGFVDSAIKRFEPEGGHLLRAIPFHEKIDPES